MCAAVGDLTINLASLRENYRRIDSLTAVNCETACAVKANAYGLGMVELSKALHQAGARSFFVATLQEGVDLRKILPDAIIYVLNGFWSQEVSQYRHHHLIPVLNSPDDIAAIKNEGDLPCALHFDTGMNRLGLTLSEAENVNTEGLNIVLVMSHFSSSDDAQSGHTQRQFELFSQIRARYKNVKASLCNSSGVFRGAEKHFDLTRPGLALYGGNPTPETKNPMLPVVSLNAPVLQIHHVKKGETAGYNQTYRFEDDANVAVIGAGYADGLLRSLSNCGVFYWKSYALPIRGRVSMDLVICDLSAVPESEYPVLYDMVEIIGVHQSIDDIAKSANTISYEIITSLGYRYSRSYID